MSCVILKRINAIHGCGLLLIVVALATFTPVSSHAAENASGQKSLLLERSIRLDDAYDFAGHSSGLLYWKDGSQYCAVVKDKHETCYVATFREDSAQSFVFADFPASSHEIIDIVKSGDDLYLLAGKQIFVLRLLGDTVYHTVRTIELPVYGTSLLESDGIVYCQRSVYSQSNAKNTDGEFIDYVLYRISDSAATLVMQKSSREVAGLVVGNLGPTKLSTIVDGNVLVSADPYGRYMLQTDLETQRTDTITLLLFGATQLHKRVVELEAQVHEHSLHPGQAIGTLRSFLRDGILPGIVLRMDKLNESEMGLLVEIGRSQFYYTLDRETGEHVQLRSLTRETLDLDAKISESRLLGVNTNCKASDSVVMSTRSSGAVDPLSGLTYREVMEAENEYISEHETPESLVIFVVE